MPPFGNSVSYKAASILKFFASLSRKSPDGGAEPRNKSGVGGV